jgi:predicted amidohydrolase YtcJ
MKTSRRTFLGGAAAAVGLATGGALARAQQGGGQGPAKAGSPQAAGLPPAPAPPADLLLINGRIHTMDAKNRVVSQLLIRGGRFAAVGDNVGKPAGIKAVDLRGRTVVPGIVDAHDHIVLVGNRPGWNTPLEHVFTIPDAIAALKTRAAGVPADGIITSIGTISAMQFAEGRLPTLAELDAVGRAVYLQGAQGGTRTNSQGRTWLAARGVTVGDDGTLGGQAAGPALLALRRELLTPETRMRGAFDALAYYARLGITIHKDSGAFHAEEPAPGIASENTYTMHQPFLALHREGRMPARLRIDFLHQDPPNATPPLPTLAPRLRNSFPFFGDEWIKTGGIGEFTGGGIEGLRAIARAGWRAEDHALNLKGAEALIASREMVHKEIPITNLRWIISHIPGFTTALADRAHALGMGVLVGWGPTRTGTNVGPPYRTLSKHPIRMGYHSDGGDITLISPWLNLYTIVTGRNLAGQAILGEETLSRQEALAMATRDNKWFIGEDDIGSIEVGCHADLAVLDRDYFKVPDEELKRIVSVLTIVGGRVMHNAGTL